MGEIFIILIIGLIWGFVADAIGKPKGVNGFWWGFFLGVIGVIVVACMSGDNKNVQRTIVVNQDYNNIKNSNKYDELEKLAHLKEIGAINEEEYIIEKNKILNENRF